MNGAVEAANKNIKKIVQKMVVTYKDWHEMLSFALHGYRTSVRTSTGAMPFSLVYGMEAVLPVEVQIPSLRVLIDVKLQEAEWVRTRYEELSLIEEKRLAAICHGQLYQQRMKRAFDRKVRPRVYHVGDMVLKRILPPQNDRRGKWTPNYEGPFVVKKVFSGGALLLTTMDGISRNRLVQKAESTESLEDIWGVTELELGAVRYFHSLAGCDVKLLKKDPRGVQEFDLRGVWRSREYKVMNQKSPDESGSSQKWKADTGFRC
ncbi:hypothetical protein KIW84_053204 [Lathyrus oleraceus]|uniref:Uncharacterized protein n=1 Tax=Pisum sativum TaxID=3888 RepID=A0A9D4WUG3_PEA|nr:hypothetical protein KIW84_053204 [Pisum sativum]